MRCGRFAPVRNVSIGFWVRCEMSGLQRKAAYLSERQIKNAVARMNEYRHSLRNKAVLQLTYLAGLRAKEVSLLRWEHLLNEDGEIGEAITLTNDITKGKSGGIIALNDALRETLSALLSQDEMARKDRKTAVIRSERGQAFKTQSIVNLLWQHYRKCDIQGASSHSGRRTFITNAARKISLVGGSMRDVQQLARHSSLQITQRYVEANSAAQKAVVNML